MKKVVLALLFIFALNKISAQGTCAGVHFTPIAQYPVALGSNYSFASFIIGNADFDNDSKEDLAFIGSGLKVSGYHILLQRNIRTGTLPSQISFDTSVSVFHRSSTLDFVVNDFNNDGKMDIAITFGSYSGLDSLEILINNGTAGSFSFIAMPIIPLSVSETNPTLKTSDFDHDGKQDLMYQGTDNKVYVLLNTAFTGTSATFAAASSYTGITFHGSPATTYRSFDQGDMNGDTLPDVAFPGYMSYSGSDTVFIYKNTSTKGTINYKLAQIFIAPDTMTTGNFWMGRYVQIKDLNGDKKSDIAIMYHCQGPHINGYRQAAQKILLLKNISTGTGIKVAFSDTIWLNKFVRKPFNYLLDDTGQSMRIDSNIEFSDFSLIYNDPCHLKPDILVSVEGCCPQPFSLITYLANTSTLSKISYSAPCWFNHFTADRASVGDFNGDGKDDLMSMCDICLSSSPGYGLSIAENISTIKVGNEKIAFDTVSVPCKANKVGSMKLKLYLPCHALANLAKDSLVIDWKPKISTSDTASLRYGQAYTVHVYNQSKKYDTTFTLKFNNPYKVGQNGVPIRILFNDTTICPGAPILLSMAKSSSVNHYIWTPDSAISNDTIFDPIVNPTVSTVYYVSGLGGQCLRDTFVNVNVHPLPVIVAKPDTIVCPGAPVMLYAYGAKLYAWSPTRHLSNDSGSITIAKVDSTTTFTVDGFDGKCHGLATAMVTTMAAPIVYAGKRWTIHSNESYTINDASVTGNYFDYWWTPHLFMNDTTLLHPTVYNSESMWFVLHSVNAYGCSSKDSVFIKFDPLGHIFVPTAFSPNNDGENDRLRIVKENIRTFHMVIFNRWGQTVFETDGLTKEWDGRYNGEPEPMGSYVYYVEATDIGGHPVNMHGNITLLR